MFPLLEPCLLIFIFTFLSAHTRCEPNSLASLNLYKSFWSCLTLSGIPSHRVILRDESSDLENYTQLNYQWQELGGEIQPAGFILPVTSSQVQSIIKCGRDHGVPIVPKSGGHSYPKYSFGNSGSFLVDLRLMIQIRIVSSGSEVEIGAGHLIGPLLVKLWLLGGYTLPLGTCSTVGISGLSLGGGHNFFSRLRGLAVQNIIELQMVTSTGEELKANKDLNSDLFWALRGAGGGSYGVVTKFKFRLFKAPSVIQHLEAIYTMRDFKEIFVIWQSLLSSKTPNNIFCYLNINGNPPVLHINYFEYNVEEFTRSPESIFPREHSVTYRLSTLNYTEFLKVAEGVHAFRIPGYSNVTRSSFPKFLWKLKSTYIQKIISPQEAQGLSDLFGSKPKIVTFFIMPYGGAVEQIAKAQGYNSSSFIHVGPRTRSLATFSIRGNAETTSKRELTSAIKWVRDAFRILETKILKNLHPRSYQNYIDTDLNRVETLSRYYGPTQNIISLIKVKQKYDPDNYFHNPQSIPTNS